MRGKTSVVSCLLWPFLIPLRLVRTAVRNTIRLVTILIGLLLISLGLIASFTIIGMVIGLPLVILGTLLMVRAIF